MAIALITGINGQDASYLAELLLDKGYEVHGTIRRTANKNLKNIENIIDKIKLHYATLENYASLYNAVKNSKPDEIYHLAAQSYVQGSFQDGFSTMDMNIHGTHYLLHIVKDLFPKSKFYYAGTSEMYGNVLDPQDELTPMNPVSPYGVSKLAGYHLCHIYRDTYKMFVCCGILFNHESPRRGKEFVTQKIAQAARNKQKVKLGNLDAKRDWGFAGDYVEAMWLMLQQDFPDDYVIATGVSHTVRELAEIAYRLVGLNYQEYVEIDPVFYRPNELHILRGDATKANLVLGWKPKTDFKSLVENMVCL
jgi:GDPmannose 4,6-dehydratase